MSFPPEKNRNFRSEGIRLDSFNDEKCGYFASRTLSALRYFKRISFDDDFYIGNFFLRVYLNSREEREGNTYKSNFFFFTAISFIVTFGVYKSNNLPYIPYYLPNCVRLQVKPINGTKYFRLSTILIKNVVSLKKKM